jgi:hypothetical protein
MQPETDMTRFTLTHTSALRLVGGIAGLFLAVLTLLCLSVPVQAAEPPRPVLALCVPGTEFTIPCHDRKEPNDTAATAKTLDGFTTISLTFFTEASSPIDQDWYQVGLAANQIITLTATTTGGGVVNMSVAGFSQDGGTALGISGGGGFSGFAVISNTSGVFQIYTFRVTNLANQYAAYQIQYTIANLAGTGTATPIPGTASADVYEVNNSPAEVLAPPNGGVVRSFLNMGSTFNAAQLPNFYSTAPLGSTRENGDVDWYFFYGRNGGRYRVTTSVQSGVDTEMFIYRDSGPLRAPGFSNTDNTGLISANDDYQQLDRGSRVEFSGDYDGQYWIKVWNKDPSPRAGAGGYNPSYNVAVQELGAAPTVTPSLPTPFPQGIDRFEYNGDLDTSTLIAPNTKYDNLNFVPFQPPTRDTVDNDFFRMPVKQGVYYTCETLDLAGGADTNLIVFNQNAPQNRDASALGGNDNISPAEMARGNFASRFTWLSGYTGIVYLLVGDVTPPRANEALVRTYALQCTIGLPNTPTPTVDPRGTATPTAPPAALVPPTAEPPEATMTPFPTPRAAQNLVVRPLDGGGAIPPTRAPSPTPRTITLDVQVFNDLNRNGLLDSGEGVANASVRLSDESSGTPLSQAYTDAEGRVRFAINNNTPVKVSIPLFGYSTIIDSPSATVRLALVPSAEFPERLP